MPRELARPTDDHPLREGARGIAIVTLVTLAFSLVGLLAAVLVSLVY